jgi:hypothetical protein
VPRISLVFREMWDSTALAPNLPQQDGLVREETTPNNPKTPLSGPTRHR